MTDTPVIVAVGAHAADMEFSAGATLLKHARDGWDTHIINLTLGEKGAAEQTVEEYAAQKQREADACAARLGATQHYLPYAEASCPSPTASPTRSPCSCADCSRRSSSRTGTAASTSTTPTPTT